MVNVACPERINDLNKKNNRGHCDKIRSGKHLLEPKNVYYAAKTGPQRQARDHWLGHQT